MGSRRWMDGVERRWDARQAARPPAEPPVVVPRPRPRRVALSLLSQVVMVALAGWLFGMVALFVYGGIVVTIDLASWIYWRRRRLIN